MKTVEIVQHDDGRVEVGLVPESREGAESGETESYLAPAESVDAALEIARDLLVGDSAALAEEAAEAEMATGFTRARGTSGGYG